MFSWLLWVVPALSLSLFTEGRAPLDVGASTPPASLSARACVGCHPGEGAEWHASRHGQAWTNATFQREYRQQPLEWCVHCHAPLRQQLAEVRGGDEKHALADEGVNCAVCHVRDGEIVAAARRPGSPHATRVRPDFGGAAFCGGCHQFNFPVFDDGGALLRYAAQPMQATVSQHLASDQARAGTSCRSCHARSPSGHAYPGARDPAMLARALAFEVCRAAGGVVELRVRNVGAGHHVPTGDVHRHLTARVWRPEAPERLFEGFIGRRFRPADGGGKEPVLDTTVPPGGAARFRVPIAALGDGDADAPLSVELRYVFTIDEFPLRGRELGEPTYHVLDERRVRPSELGPCAPLAGSVSDVAGAAP